MVKAYKNDVIPFVQLLNVLNLAEEHNGGKTAYVMTAKKLRNKERETGN